MEEFSDVQNIITKLKSSLPICRICLEISMEYIEFEGTLCVVDGEEITYSDGFNEICSPTIELPDDLPSSFCVKCGNDLLNAYLFLKRVENANFLLHRLKSFTEKSTKLKDGYPAVLVQSESDSIEDDLKDELHSEDPDDESDEDCKRSPIPDEISIKSETQDHFEIETECLVGDESNVADTLTKEDVTTVSSLVVDTDFESDDENDAESIANHEELTWICDECGQACDTKYSLTEHYKEHQPNERACLQCNRLFQKSEELDNHLLFHEYSETLKNHSDKKVHRCTLCEMNCHTEAEFVDHINTHRGKKRYVCDICSNTFHTKLNLHAHNCRVHTKLASKRKKAKECEKSAHCQGAVNTAHTKKHIEAETSATDFACPDCGKKFTTKLGLKAHSVTHKQRKFVCHLCDKICLTDFTLRKHIQYIHLTDRLKHQCEDCGLFFQYPSYLRDHQRKHNAKSRFQCPHCDRSYCRKPQLDIHMRYHTNDFRYKCDQCDKCYVTKSNLMDHIRSAHFKVTYDCNECDLKFKSVTGLRKHKYTHTGYPYSCPLCLIGQTSRSGMKAHLFGVHKDSVTEEDFNEMFPIIIPKTGYRRPRVV